MSTKTLPSATPGEIVAEFEIPGVDMIHGVTFDGTHVWFASDPDRDLKCVDTKTGKVVKRIARNDCQAGLAWDGSHLWSICGERIVQIDPKSGETKHSIPVPSKHCSGMAWAAGYLWVGSFDDRKIHKVDPKSGA